jgi:large subunit ribosomal protein L15
MRDLLKKLPKLRGHGKNRARTVRIKDGYVPVNLALLEKHFNVGDVVNPIAIARAGIGSTRGGKVMPVKILGTGTLTKALSVSGCTASATAKTAIEAAGGTLL